MLRKREMKKMEKMEKFLDVGLPGHGEGEMTDVLGGPGGMVAAPRRPGEG